MDLQKAKKAVVDAGKMLVKDGLIQRTWGNVSCRIDENKFCITPSGRDYLSLTEDDIVVVSISDLSFDGTVKPSSEKAIHAMCYALRPEVNFVIHTHQTYASLAGLSGLDINGINGKDAEIIGDNIPVAAYGLPGTKKLCKGVTSALKRSSSKTVLMQHHGALCVGESAEDAFNVANATEKVCKDTLIERYRELTGKAADSFSSLSAYVANNLMRATSDVELDAYASVRSFGTAEMTPVNGGETICVDLESGMPLDKTVECPETAMLHAEIYSERKDVNAIIHSKEDGTLAVSRIGRTIKPFLDDFAQIAGMSVKNAEYDPNNSLKTAKKVVKKLKRREAVLISHNGAFCVGADTDEASAVSLVTEKGCKAFIAAELYGKKPINAVESLLMRVIYKTKYSKKAKQK